MQDSIKKMINEKHIKLSDKTKESHEGNMEIIPREVDNHEPPTSVAVLDGFSTYAQSPYTHAELLLRAKELMKDSDPDIVKLAQLVLRELEQ